MKAIEEELEKFKEEQLARNKNPWRTPSPEVEVFSRETVKRRLDDLVGQVVNGGKKTKV